MKNALIKEEIMSSIYLEPWKHKGSKCNRSFLRFPDVSHYTDGLVEGGHITRVCDWLLEKFYIAFVPGEVFGKEGFLLVLML